MTARRRTTTPRTRRGVSLSVGEVEDLLGYLDRVADPTATAEERADVRTELCGYLGYSLGYYGQPDTTSSHRSTR